MGIMSMLSNAARFVKDKFIGAAKKAVPALDNEVPPDIDTSNYLHVSVPLIPIENPVLRKLLGRDYMLGKGQTRNVGNNAMKRVADALGANNKQRRMLRSRMKRRAAELRAGAPMMPAAVENARSRLALATQL